MEMGGNKFSPSKEAEKRYKQRSGDYGNIENILLNTYKDSASKSDNVYNDLLSRYGYFADTGGWDPSRVSSIDEDISGFKNFAKTGGLTPEAISRMRGSGVFDEFAKTGGYSDADLANIRGRTAAQTPAFYDSLKNELARQNTSQGGYSPGYTYEMAKSARDAYRGGTDAIRETEIGLKDAVNKGRMWGGSNISSSEDALQSLLTGNQLKGLAGSSGLTMNLVNSMNQGKLAGMSGLENLRTTPGADFQYMNQLLKGMGMSDDSANQLLTLYAKTKGTSVWNKILGTILQYGPMLLGGKGKKDVSSNPYYDPYMDDSTDPSYLYGE